MENDRLITAIGMMGSTSSAGDGEAVNAFRAASAMLAKRGLRWSDVADLAFGPTRGRKAHPPSPPRPSPVPTPTSGRDFTAMFDEMFDGVFSAAGFGGTARGPRGAARARRRIEGSAIPGIVSGLPDIGLQSSNGPMILDVVGDVDTYGPLVCILPSLQDVLREAARARGQVMVGVRQPSMPGRHCVVTSVSRP